MSKWNKPELVELGIEKTEHNWLGRYNDGGYIGDGVLSGHSTNTKPSNGSDSGSNNSNNSSSTIDTLS